MDKFQGQYPWHAIVDTQDWISASTGAVQVDLNMSKRFKFSEEDVVSTTSHEHK